MPAPNPTRLFHITALANIPAILARGALVSKTASAVAGINYQNIAHAGAQGARARRTVPNPPGGGIHDYVPFYFAPRSPMLYAINGGKVLGCNWRQEDIAHFETTVTAVTGTGQPIVFYDRNATLEYSVPYTDLAHLGTAVAWDLLTEAPQKDGFCTFWQSKTTPERYVDRMERRQAEFLVKDTFPLRAMTRIGVVNVDKANEVRAMLLQHQIALPVVVMPDWYF